MERLLSNMESGNYTEELLSEFPPLATKLNENKKLKYRINIMKKAYSALISL